MRVPSTHRSPVLIPGGYVDTATRPASEGGAQSLRGTGQDHRSSTRSVVCPLTHLPPGAGVISAGPNKLPNHSSGEGEGEEERRVCTRVQRHMELQWCTTSARRPSAVLLPYGKNKARQK
jgi:hypothetical protein